MIVSFAWFISSRHSAVIRSNMSGTMCSGRYASRDIETGLCECLRFQFLAKWNHRYYTSWQIVKIIDIKIGILFLNHENVGVELRHWSQTWFKLDKSLMHVLSFSHAIFVETAVGLHSTPGGGIWNNHKIESMMCLSNDMMNVIIERIPFILA